MLYRIYHPQRITPFSFIQFHFDCYHENSEWKKKKSNWITDQLCSIIAQSVLWEFQLFIQVFKWSKLLFWSSSDSLAIFSTSIFRNLSNKLHEKHIQIYLTCCYVKRFDVFFSSLYFKIDDLKHSISTNLCVLFLSGNSFKGFTETTMPIYTQTARLLLISMVSSFRSRLSNNLKITGRTNLNVLIALSVVRCSWKLLHKQKLKMIFVLFSIPLNMLIFSQQRWFSRNSDLLLHFIHRTSFQMWLKVFRFNFWYGQKFLFVKVRTFHRDFIWNWWPKIEDL